MPSITLNLPPISLSSTWVCTYHQVGDYDLHQYYYSYSTPTTDTGSTSADLSGIPAGSTIDAATLAYSISNSRGDFNGGGASPQNVKSQITAGSNGAFGAKTFSASFQAAGGSGTAPEGGSRTYENTCDISGITLTIAYTLPYTAASAPSVVALNKISATPGEALTLSFSGAQSGYNNAITGYLIRRSLTLGGPYADLQTVRTAETSGTAQVLAPSPSGQYYFVVRALGAVAGYDSPDSEAVASVTVVLTAPKPPDTLTLEKTAANPNEDVSLSWAGAEDGVNNPITDWQIMRRATENDSWALFKAVSGGNVRQTTVPSPNGDGESMQYAVRPAGPYLTGAVSSVYATLTTDYNLGTSTPALSNSSVDAGNTVTLTLSGARALDAAHTVTVAFGAQTASYAMAAGVSSQTIAIPLDWLVEIPSAASGVAIVGVSTAGGGRADLKLTIAAGEDVIPTIGDCAIAPVSLAEDVSPLSPVPDGWGTFVAGFSRAQITIPDGAATGVYGSTIVAYRVFCAGQTFQGTGAPFSATTAVLAGGDLDVSLTARCVAVDSRGREGARVLSFTVYPYKTPFAEGLRAARCTQAGEENDDGTYITVSGAITYSTCAGHSHVTASVAYREKGASDWISAGSITGTDGVSFGGGAIDITKNYDVRVTLLDDLSGTARYYMAVPRANWTLHLCYDAATGKTGAAFGRAAQSAELLDVGWNTRIRGALQADGPASIAGDLSVSGALTAPNYPPDADEMLNGLLLAQATHTGAITNGQAYFDIDLSGFAWDELELWLETKFYYTPTSIRDTLFLNGESDAGKGLSINNAGGMYQYAHIVEGIGEPTGTLKDIPQAARVILRKISGYVFYTSAYFCGYDQSSNAKGGIYVGRIVAETVNSLQIIRTIGTSTTALGECKLKIWKVR